MLVKEDRHQSHRHETTEVMGGMTKSSRRLVCDCYIHKNVHHV